MFNSERFNGCTQSATTVNSGIEFGGFANAIFTYLFQLPEDERGVVDYVAFSSPIETEAGVVDRFAKVIIKSKQNRQQYYFYIFAEKYTRVDRDWKVVARSKLLNGLVRMPYEREMIFL